MRYTFQPKQGQHAGISFPANMFSLWRCFAAWSSWDERHGQVVCWRNRWPCNNGSPQKLWAVAPAFCECARDGKLPQDCPLDVRRNLPSDERHDYGSPDRAVLQSFFQIARKHFSQRRFSSVGSCRDWLRLFTPTWSSGTCRQKIWFDGGTHSNYGEWTEPRANKKRSLHLACGIRITFARLWQQYHATRYWHDFRSWASRHLDDSSLANFERSRPRLWHDRGTCRCCWRRKRRRTQCGRGPTSGSHGSSHWRKISLLRQICPDQAKEFAFSGQGCWRRSPCTWLLATDEFWRPQVFFYRIIVWSCFGSCCCG